ncbi:MFS transporter [Alteromonas sp. KUL49]|uniref:MFS transporter n=1 Tax=Alteromonas sp. KUL49 TaxID=2480798 RepID=UPI00102F0893|nr:MFS transporter [Alteromonas sp. KUL49]TAP39262.1 MFS transporter [Alteromonas sp. KUL49]GEA12042.1 MFS transporter [Alteromonas sp. KUL49]
MTNPLASRYFVQYMFAAVLSRICTGGAIIAVILLAKEYGADSKLAGALAACLTVPHLLGPFYGKWLDTAKNPNLILAFFAGLYTIAFQVAIQCFQHNTLLGVFASLLVCGVCSAFMMGGLGTQLIYIIPDNLNYRRKGQSFDTFTYGIGHTLGPLTIALLITQFSTSMSATILTCLPAVASVFIVCFPKRHSEHAISQKSTPNFNEIWHTFLSSSSLKITLFMTSSASFAIAALPVLAVYLSEGWNQPEENGAYLATLYGIGGLCGALLLLVSPLKGEALQLLKRIGSLLFLSIVFLAISWSFPLGLSAYWVCGLINALFFASTLAARTEYAPKEGAAQVYMWVAAAKVGAGALGAFTTGILLEYHVNAPLMLSLSVLGGMLFLCFYTSIAKK